MRGARRILLAVIAVVVIVGAGVWWLFLRDTSPEKLTLPVPLERMPSPICTTESIW